MVERGVVSLLLLFSGLGHQEDKNSPTPALSSVSAVPFPPTDHSMTKTEGLYLQATDSTLEIGSMRGSEIKGPSKDLRFF